jgi:Zn-dependent protease with chaperone function
MISLHLLVLAGLVSFVATRWLPAASWVRRSPRLGLAAWYTVLVTVISSVAGAAVSLVATWRGTSAMVCAWWMWCAEAIRGAHGGGGWLVATAVACVLLVVAVRAGRAGWRLGRAVAQRRRDHAAMLAVLGQERAELGATVVDCPLPVAYVVPGRPARVVVSTGALAVLPAGQVAAVLAHERAHAGGRHHLLVDGVRLLCAAFPTAALFIEACRQVDRLVELHADDVAIRGHAGVDLARALVAMAEAAAGQRHPMNPLVPVGAVAATGGGALERVRRLLDPPVALPRAVHLAAGVGLTTLSLTPALLVVAAAFFPALAGCLSVS